LNEKIDFSITGNPFVDTGQAIISYLAGKESFTELDYNDVVDVFNSGKEIIDWNSRSKSFTMVFGNNGPLTQTSIKDKAIRKNNYRIYLSGLLDQIPDSNINNQASDLCECCGEYNNVDLNSIYSKLDIKNPKDINHVGRHLFPLIGSLGSDAQSLPSASRMFNICPRCLFAVSYLPLGTRLLQGKLIVFEGAYQPFVQDIIGSIVDENKRLLSLGGDNIEIIGKKQPSGMTIKWLCDTFENLQKALKREQIPEKSELNIWLFSNSGTGANCTILQIPDFSVKFLWDAKRNGLSNEIASIASNEHKLIKNSNYHMLNCIRNKTDYSGLYPYKKYKGSSVKLFSYYQNHILNISHESLIVSQKLAKSVFPGASKEQKTWLKSDVFHDVKNRNLLKGKIAELVQNGTFSINEYFNIFPIISLKPLQVDFRGFNFVKYFFHHLDEKIPDYNNITQMNGESMKMNPIIMEAATLYFNDYCVDYGLKRFKKDVLDEFKHGRIHINWFRSMMCRLSEKHEGFGPEDWNDTWHDLCHDEKGNFVGYELLFQLRLVFSDLYRVKSQELNEKDVSLGGLNGK
jgi:CRISPR-associated protein Cst1